MSRTLPDHGAGCWGCEKVELHASRAPLLEEAQVRHVMQGEPCSDEQHYSAVPC